MRSVVQRVKWARVSVNGELVGTIEAGICALVGVGVGDTEIKAIALAHKLCGLRIFEDEQGKMNRGLREVGGAILAISQFTLFGDVSRGRRPSFGEAMEPRGAEVLFSHFCDAVKAEGVPLATGRFRTDMQVELLNDGPVTLFIEL